MSPPKRSLFDRLENEPLATVVIRLLMYVFCIVFAAAILWVWGHRYAAWITVIAGTLLIGILSLRHFSRH
jgi:fatty acid desaturase